MRSRPSKHTKKNGLFRLKRFILARFNGARRYSGSWIRLDLQKFCDLAGFSLRHARRLVQELKSHDNTLRFYTHFQQPTKRHARGHWVLLVATEQYIVKDWDEAPLHFDRQGRSRHVHPHLLTSLRDRLDRRAPNKQSSHTPKPASSKIGEVSDVDEGIKGCSTFFRKSAVLFKQPPGRASGSIAHPPDPHKAFSDCAARHHGGGCPPVPPGGALPPLLPPEVFGLGDRCAPPPPPRSPKPISPKIRRLAFFVSGELENLHWDNCKVETSRKELAFWTARQLHLGHSIPKIRNAYYRALHACHAEATDAQERWLPTSTCSRAAAELDADGLDRWTRIQNFYQLSNPSLVFSHARNAAEPPTYAPSGINPLATSRLCPRST